MTSANVKDLEAGWIALRNASQEEELTECNSKETTLSANLSVSGMVQHNRS
jgi:hypothetical protein